MNNPPLSTGARSFDQLHERVAARYRERLASAADIVAVDRAIGFLRDNRHRLVLEPPSLVADASAEGVSHDLQAIRRRCHPTRIWWTFAVQAIRQPLDVPSIEVKLFGVIFLAWLVVAGFALGWIGVVLGAVVSPLVCPPIWGASLLVVLGWDSRTYRKAMQRFRELRSTTISELSVDPATLVEFCRSDLVQCVAGFRTELKSEISLLLDRASRLRVLEAQVQRDMGPGPDRDDSLAVLQEGCSEVDEAQERILLLIAAVDRFEGKILRQATTLERRERELSLKQAVFDEIRRTRSVMAAVDDARAAHVAELAAAVHVLAGMLTDSRALIEAVAEVSEVSETHHQ